MAITHIAGEAANTVADLPSVGSVAPDFALVDSSLAGVRLSDFAGKRLVLNIFPSVDTGICAQSVRHFNRVAAGLDNTRVLCVSKDLPFALGRFCASEGIEDLVVASAFRSDFGVDYGVELADSPLAGLLARAVMVISEAGKVIYVALNDELKEEPGYEAVIDFLRG